MKHLTLTLLLICAQQIYAQSEIVKFPLPGGHKAEGTMSIKLNDSTSLHLIVTTDRKTRQTEYKPFILRNNTVRELNSISSNIEMQIFAAHLSGHLLTVLYKSDIEGKVYGFDINTDANSYSPLRQVLNDEYITSIKMEDATYFFGQKDNGLFITRINNTQDITQKYYHTTKETYSWLKKELSRNRPVYIKTDAYINIGSTAKNQLYKYGDVFYLTHDREDRSVTNIYELPFTEKESYDFVEKVFSITLPSSAISAFPTKVIFKSFLVPNHLFAFNVGDKGASIGVFDYATKKRLASFNYLEDVFGPYHEYYADGKLSEPVKNKFIKVLRKSISGSLSLFLAVNTTTDNGFLVEAGNINAYTYQYDPFRWHQQFHNQMWQFQQQTLQQSIPNLNRFGPNSSEDYFEDTMWMQSMPLKKNSVKFSLDGSLKITQEMSNPLHEYVDYESTLEEAKKSPFFKHKHVSYTGLGKNIIFMYFEESSKSFIIKRNAVKNQ